MTGAEKAGNRLLAGPFSARFEDDFLDTLSGERRLEPLGEAIVLVTSNYLGLHLRRALARRCNGHANIRFLTFADLAWRMVEASGVHAKRTAFQKDVEELMIGDLAEETAASGGAFSAAAGGEGFSAALRRTFHDLLDGGATGLPSQPGRLGELAALFCRHRQRYSSNFSTTADRIRDAASASFRKTFGASRLYLYGFYDFTEIQRRLISSIAKEAELFAWMPSPSKADPVSSDTLDFLCKLCGPARVSAPQNPPFVHALSAAGVHAEAEAVVRRLLSILSAEPVPLNEVGILLHDRQEYLGAFRHVLDRAGIPYVLAGGTSLSETPLGAAVLCALECLEGNCDRFDLIHALARFPFRADLTKGAGDSADWDAWTRRAYCTKDFGTFPSRLKRLAADFKVRGNPRSGSIRAFGDLVASWNASMEVLRKAATWRDFASALSSWLEMAAEPSPERAKTVSAASALASLDGLVSPGPGRFRRVLALRLSSATLRKGVFGRDGIYLGSAAAVRAVPFRILCVPGLVEGLFPAPGRQDPLLPDTARRLLNRTHGLGMNLSERRLAEERALFEMIRSAASSHLVCSFSRMEIKEGRERRPSSFFTQAALGAEIMCEPLLPWRRDSGAVYLDRSDWLSSRLGRAVLEERAAARAFLARHAPLHDSIRGWTLSRLWAGRWTEFDGMLGRDVAAPGLFSPTDVSDYAVCPHRYFLRKVLRIEYVDAPEEILELRPKDRGQITHEILFRLFGRLRAEGRLPLGEKELIHAAKALDSVAQEVFSKAEDCFPIADRRIFSAERDLMLSDLRAFLQRECSADKGFIPHDFETSFGMVLSEPSGRLSTQTPLVIALPSGEVRLRGRVDRIDVSPDGRRARVVDYKTGSVGKASSDSLGKGRAVQLPVYLSALRLIMPQVDVGESHGVLMSTSFKEGLPEVRFSGAALASRRADFERVLDTVASGVSSGVFVPRPGESAQNCKVCDFRPVCGTNVERLFERKREDPIIAPLLALGDIK